MKLTIIYTFLVLSRSPYSVLSNPVANPDPEVRSIGRVKCRFMYPFAISVLWIRICH